MEHTLNETEAELLVQLVEMFQQSDDTLLTTTELVGLLTCSRWKIIEMLHQLRADGRLVEGSKTKIGRLGSGGTYTVPAYGLKKAE